MKYITGRHNTAFLDQMTREFAEIDAREAQRLRARQFQETFDKAIKVWYARTEKVSA